MNEKEILEIEEQHGPLIVDNGKGIRLGLESFAELYRRKSDCIYVSNEKSFYNYDPQSGLWKTQNKNEMIYKISKTILEFNREQGLVHELDVFRRPNYIHDISIYLESIAAQNSSIFDKKHTMIHCTNGMLLFVDGTWQLNPFSSVYHSRNQCQMTFDPSADCPRFKQELLAPLLEDDDIDLLQKYFGQCLLGTNLTQTICLMTGSGGSGKGTLANILELIVGANNYMQIRPNCISKQFETSSFVGKTLLCGKESPTSFFTTKGMGILKSLVGDDALRVELKHSNETRMIHGNFNVFIVGNAIPMLEFENSDDVSAWRRRMRWIKCKDYKPSQRIDHFADLLFKEEGSGILNWCLEGARQLLSSESNCLALSEMQQNRLDFLFGQPFQMENFLSLCLEEAPGSTLTTEEIYATYISMAKRTLWDIMPEKKFQTKLPQSMLQRFGLLRNRDIKRATADGGRWTTRSGYRNVRVRKFN